MKPVKRPGATVAGSTPPPPLGLPLTRAGLNERMRQLGEEVLAPARKTAVEMLGAFADKPFLKDIVSARAARLALAASNEGSETFIPGDMAPLLLDMLPNRPSLFGQPFEATTTIPKDASNNLSNVFMAEPATMESISSDMKAATEVVLNKHKLAAVVPANPLLLSPRVVQGLKDDVERCKVDLAAKTRTQRFTFAKTAKGVPIMEPCDRCGADTAARRHGTPRHMICDERFSAKELVDTIRGVQHFLDQK